MRTIGLEFKLKNAKNTFETHQSIHLECKSDSDDEKKEVVEFTWPSEAKPYTCSSLKPIPKNHVTIQVLRVKNIIFVLI